MSLSLHTYLSKRITISLYLLAMSSSICAQHEEIFDSLQNLIRKEVTEGTNTFLPVALAYDSVAILSGDTLKMGKGKNFIGMYHYYNGNHRQAISYYLEALPYFTAIRDTYYIAMMHNNIGAAYEYRKEPENSISYYQSALRYFTMLQDTLWMANVLNNIGIQLNIAIRHDESLENFKKARLLYVALQDSSMLAVINTNMSECYRLKGDYQKAKALNLEYLDAYKRFHTTDVLGNVHSSLANTYLALGQLEESKAHNAMAIQIRTENNFRFNLPNNYQTESLIFEKEGDYKKALMAYKDFKAAQDSMFNKEKDERITQLITEYEVQEKDQEIQMLASQNELKNLRIEKSNRQKLLFGLGATSLLIFAIALFYLLRLKSRTNADLAEKNILISKALAEKDILLREIHHRVKNNLQMISALLYLHGKSVDDSTAQEALMESQNRVQSMAMIHQNLYQDENLLGVSIKDYLDKLLNHLISSYNIEKDRITILKKIDIPQMDVDTVIPLALIINELISNALKYAFRDGRRGEIKVSLEQTEGLINLEVSDDGMGLPEHFSVESSSNFGLKLINILCDRLGATWSAHSGKGTRIEIHIPQKIAA
ncbi:MAG: tetratricopeptide repeat protein [Saprospiraceae bacterium]|nr:tetratricopeptide repeat protein [Candidatus Opimibacter skivensis]